MDVALQTEDPAEKGGIADTKKGVPGYLGKDPIQDVFL
jgi:hypothetical protein